jgi:tryptophan-rich sensory protein
MTESASNSKDLMARLVVGLIVAFLLAGVLTYGFSAEVRDRVWHDLLERPSHLFRFRFILQPAMAGLAALHDGMADARNGRTPYFWALVTRPSHWLGRLEQGVISTARVLLLGLVMDTIYQLIVLKTFYPAEAAIVAIVLAFIPYVLLRGPITRFALYRRAGKRV